MLLFKTKIHKLHDISIDFESIHFIKGDTMKTKKHKPQKAVKTTLIADFFGMHRIDVNKHIAKGERLDFVYIVFNREDLTRQQKKDYLYNTSLSKEMKDNLWTRFIGDYWFEYCKTTSNTPQVRI